MVHRIIQNYLSLKGSIKGKKNQRDITFDKKVSKFIAKTYAEKNSRS